MEQITIKGQYSVYHYRIVVPQAYVTNATVFEDDCYCCCAMALIPSVRHLLCPAPRVRGIKR